MKNISHIENYDNAKNASDFYARVWGVALRPVPAVRYTLDNGTIETAVLEDLHGTRYTLQELSTVTEFLINNARFIKGLK